MFVVPFYAEEALGIGFVDLVGSSWGAAQGMDQGMDQLRHIEGFVVA